MSDRSYVTLTVLTSQSSQAEEIFDYSADDQGEKDGKTWYDFSDVGYGILPFGKKLQKAGIAHDSSWESGSGYGPGTHSCRFTEFGDLVLQDIGDDQINPDLDALMALIDKPDELRQHILDHQKMFYVLPWDNQEEYGKVYRAKQLISP